MTDEPVTPYAPSFVEEDQCVRLDRDVHRAHRARVVLRVQTNARDAPKRRWRSSAYSEGARRRRARRVFFFCHASSRPPPPPPSPPSPPSPPPWPSWRSWGASRRRTRATAGVEGTDARARSARRRRRRRSRRGSIVIRRAVETVPRVRARRLPAGTGRDGASRVEREDARTPERAQASREDASARARQAASAPETRRASRVPLMLARVPGRGRPFKVEGALWDPHPPRMLDANPGGGLEGLRREDAGPRTLGPGNDPRRGAARDEEKCRRFEVVPFFLLGQLDEQPVGVGCDSAAPSDYRHRSPVGTTHLSRAPCARRRCHRRWRRRASTPAASPLGDVATLADRPAASRASGVAPRSPSPPGRAPRARLGPSPAAGGHDLGVVPSSTSSRSWSRRSSWLGSCVFGALGVICGFLVPIDPFAVNLTLTTYLLAFALVYFYKNEVV